MRYSEHTDDKDVEFSASVECSVSTLALDASRNSKGYTVTMILSLDLHTRKFHRELTRLDEPN